MAFNLANFAADYLGGRVYRVIYPAYSKIQNDRDSLTQAVLKTLQYVGIFALPFGIGMFLLGGDFLEFAYGPKWTGAQAVLKILALAVTLYGLSVVLLDKTIYREVRKELFR